MHKLHKPHKFRKRPYLLLEVLIAFVLIAFCIIPLLYPHALILKSQKDFTRKIELDHTINILTAQILERLYTNEIHWNLIENEQFFAVDTAQLPIRSSPFPYKGGYQFKIIKSKPNKNENPPITANLLHVRILFVPQDQFTTLEEMSLNKNHIQVEFDIFVKRDLSHLVTQG